METLQDLLDEVKRRTILVGICVISLAYLMSLTSTSVWINIPVAILIIAVMRRLSSEIEVRWRAPVYEGPSHLHHLHRRQLAPSDPLLSATTNVASNRWRRSIDSPAVEEAVDELTRCVVDEWVTNLWYSSITPDQDAPEELRILINGVISEVSQRAKCVNLITLLSRDMVDLVGSHLELYRRMQERIGPNVLGTLSSEERDERLKEALISGRELHPALISPDAEHKVLQRLIGGVVALVLRPQDARCRLLRNLARELLACAVLRPILNFACPGFINEMIESLAVASAKQNLQQANQASNVEASESASTRSRAPERLPPRKPSLSGLELTELGVPESVGGGPANAKSTREIQPAKGSETMVTTDQEAGGPIVCGEWVQMLEAVTQRRTEALAPEHLDNLWAKGRNYRKREVVKAATLGVTVQQATESPINPIQVNPPETKVGAKVEMEGASKITKLVELKGSNPTPLNKATGTGISEAKRDTKSVHDQFGVLLFGEAEQGEEKLSGIGFAGVGARVTTSQMLHPLDTSDNLQAVGTRSLEAADHSSCSVETLDNLPTLRNIQENAGVSGHPLDTSNEPQKLGITGQDGSGKAVRMLSHRRSRSIGGGLEGWQELEGVSHHQEGILTLLNTGEGPAAVAAHPASNLHNCNSTENAVQVSTRIGSGNPSSSLTSHLSLSKLHCRVIGAHFEKTGSKAFAVYNIRVTDSDSQTWRVQRRFRNFEQLHRRLKDMMYYCLNLPPKRFLSSNLDNDFIRERCILLDKYLKDLLAIPSIAELHEVWDFLSVNSQHYAFINSPSVMTTLAVNVDDAVDDMFRQIRGVSDDIQGALKTATSGIRQRRGSSSNSSHMVAATHIQGTSSAGSSILRFLGASQTLSLTDSGFGEKAIANSLSEDDEERVALAGSAQGFGSVDWHSDSEIPVDLNVEAQVLGPSTHMFGSLDVRDSRYFDGRLERALSEGHSPVESSAGSDMVDDELAIPQDWSPPKVSVPLLNLVDLIFQLQGRGWIRNITYMVPAPLITNFQNTEAASKALGLLGSNFWAAHTWQIDACVKGFLEDFWKARINCFIKILQLGIGDAFDDWLLSRIQWLRREDVVASGIRGIQRVLWPDGIFITKHRSRVGVSQRKMGDPQGIGGERREGSPPVTSFEQRLEAARRAMVVREIILDRAPATLVSLIGRKQYQRCAKDIYYFLQSTVCVKQLAYSLLEMLLLAAFPELHDLIVDVRSSIT